MSSSARFAFGLIRTRCTVRYAVPALHSPDASPHPNSQVQSGMEVVHKIEVFPTVGEKPTVVILIDDCGEVVAGPCARGTPGTATATVHAGARV